MIYRITIEISGENFEVEEFLNNRKESFYIEAMHKKGEKILAHKSDKVHISNYLSLSHSNRFCGETNRLQYEEWYIKFLEENYLTWMNNGAEYVNVWTDLYIAGDNMCSFELFSRQLLKRIRDFDIAFPIDIFYLNEVEFEKLKSEMRTFQ